MRKVKLTKYMDNFYHIIFSVAGKKPPYIKRQVEDNIVRMFEQTGRIYHHIEKDKRRNFLNYYFIMFKLLGLMGKDELLP